MNTVKLIKDAIAAKDYTQIDRLAANAETKIRDLVYAEIKRVVGVIVRPKPDFYVTDYNDGLAARSVDNSFKTVDITAKVKTPLITHATLECSPINRNLSGRDENTIDLRVFIKTMFDDRESGGNVASIVFTSHGTHIKTIDANGQTI